MLQPYLINYYHFVVESLPRLLMAVPLLKNDEEIRIMTGPLRPFVKEFLAMLGIDVNTRVIEVIDWDPSIVHHVNVLYVPRPTAIYAPPKELIYLVRETFLSIAQVCFIFRLLFFVRVVACVHFLLFI